MQGCNADVILILQRSWETSTFFFTTVMVSHVVALPYIDCSCGLDHAAMTESRQRH